MKVIRTIWLALLSCLIITWSQAQDEPHLHVNPKWKECSFQLDPSLTQEAWRQFTAEAGLVAYFRPLVDAKPMGQRKFEISILQWKTAFNEKKDAWNNTFVHPDSAHWLKEGPRLAFSGLTFRAGLTDKLDAGIYFTKNPGANYGFYGANVQYNWLNNTSHHWAAAARASFTSMFGPEDLNLTTYGLDVLASKEFQLYRDWLSVSPYAGVSTYVSRAHEKTDHVNLKDENCMGVQAMAGAVLRVSAVRLGIEYNAAHNNTVSFKLGAAF